MKRARIDVTAEVFSDAAAVLKDHGLKIVAPEVIRLTVEGDPLPEECEGQCPLVRVLINTEQHGMQIINRVHSLTVIPEPAREAAE